MNTRMQHGHPYENLPLPYHSLDSKGILLDVNEAWIDRLGYARGDVIGRWFGDFLTPESQEAFQDRFDGFIRASKIENVELQMTRKDDSCISVLVNGITERDDDGQFVRTHCLLNEITHLWQMERELQQANVLANRLLETANAFVVVLDAKGRLPYSTDLPSN